MCLKRCLYCLLFLVMHSSFKSRASQSTFAAQRQKHPDELGRVAGRKWEIAELGQRFSVSVARTPHFYYFPILIFLKMMLIKTFFFDLLSFPQPVRRQKAQRLLPTNLYVVLFNFKGREADELDLKYVVFTRSLYTSLKTDNIDYKIKTNRIMDSLTFGDCG